MAPELTRKTLIAAIGMGALLLLLGNAAPSVVMALGGLTVTALSAAVSKSQNCSSPAGRFIANGWLIAALISSVFAFAQYFGQSAQLGPWVNPTEAGEAFANLRQRNQFATLTAIGLLALVWQVQRGLRVAWAGPAAALLAAANAASASRTGALQMVLVTAMALWWVRPFQRNVAGVCLTSLAAYALAAAVLPLALLHGWNVHPANAFGRLAADDGCNSRAVLWGNVTHLISQKPWWGWGWGELDYAHFATLYPGPRFCDILDNAHNLPLHLAVELGIPLAVLACGGFGWWALRQRPWRETNPVRQLAWAVIAVILLHSLLEYPLWYGPFQMALGFSLGLLASHRKEAGPPRIAGPREQGAVTAILLAALLYAGWDYHGVSQLYTPPGERGVLYRDRPLPRIGDSWFFADQLAFAALSITPLTRENAAQINALAMQLLHYSPEPRVIEVAIDSSIWIGRDDLALWLLARLRAAFPQEAASRPFAVPPTPASAPAQGR